MRSVKKGVFLIASVILAIAAVILLNSVVSLLPEEYTKLDLSGNGTFTLTQQTRDICSSLTDDVGFILICDESKKGGDIAIISQLIGRYADFSEHITLSEVDPALRPDFTLAYSEFAIENGSVIVTGPKRNKIVSYSDIFDIKTSGTSAKVDVNFRGEQALTSAVAYVISDINPKVCVLSGHGEAVADEGILAAIWGESYIIEDLSLVTVEEIPSDVKCVLINDPKTDLTDHERSVLRKYLNNGGNLYLLSGDLKAELPNLMKIVGEYGLSLRPGKVIEPSISYSYRGQASFVLPDNNYHAITAPLYAKDRRVLLRNPRAIDTDINLEGVSITPLIFSSKSSLLKINPDSTKTSRDFGDKEGSFALGAVSERTVKDGKISKLVLFGSSDLTNDTMDKNVSGNNRDMFINALAFLSDWEQTISIRSTEVSGGKLAPSDLQRTVWGIIFPVLVILVLIVCGACVMIKRRKR